MLAKLITRLRFINVEHGLALDKFFSSIGEIASPANNVNFDRIQKHVRLSRGKYTRFKIELDILRAIPHIVFLYGLSFRVGIGIRKILERIKRKKIGSNLQYNLVFFH